MRLLLRILISKLIQISFASRGARPDNQEREDGKTSACDRTDRELKWKMGTEVHVMEDHIREETLRAQRGPLGVKRPLGAFLAPSGGRLEATWARRRRTVILEIFWVPSGGPQGAQGPPQRKHFLFFFERILLQQATSCFFIEF